MNEEMMHETYAQDVKKYNYMISPSAFTTEIFQSAFRINRERLIWSDDNGETMEKSHGFSYSHHILYKLCDEYRRERYLC